MVPPAGAGTVPVNVLTSYVVRSAMLLQTSGVGAASGGLSSPPPPPPLPPPHATSIEIARSLLTMGTSAVVTEREHALRAGRTEAVRDVRRGARIAMRPWTVNLVCEQVLRCRSRALQLAVRNRRNARRASSARA